MHNIILLITDTFRYDNLGDKAKEMPVRTPEMDTFIDKQATSVEGFYTGSFPTIPHRTDIATGLLGWPNYGWQPIDQSGQNHIGRMLSNKGYASQLICDCPHLFNARFQFGFTAAYQTRGQEGDKALLHLNDPIEVVMPHEKTRMRPLYKGYPLSDQHRWHNRYWRYETETFPAKTGNLAVRWLEENHKAGPFFLWVDFFDPHEPWDPPEYMVKRYTPDYDGIPMIHPNYGNTKAYTDDELRNLRAHYAAEAELVDRWIGRVLQKIDDLQMWENTVVVITSDHGMSLGEHSRTGKSNISDDDNRYWPIYPEIGHVPFLVAAPDVPKGNILDVFGQPMDFLPTVCDLAGVQVDQPIPFHGESLAEALRNGKGKHRDYVVSGCFARSKEGGAVPSKVTTPFLVTEKWGYTPVGAEGNPELYDISVDPLAANNISKDNQDIVKQMHGLLIDHLNKYEAPQDTLKCWGKNPTLNADGSWAIDYSDDK
ncbi:sulfatase-like hydrolase/transferase [Candidatus Poribacteria bacterium]|nr:sulfatase-like hydrolase/transferase [Candidatus Poribacteria bacterium]